MHDTYNGRTGSPQAVVFDATPENEFALRVYIAVLLAWGSTGGVRWTDSTSRTRHVEALKRCKRGRVQTARDGFGLCLYGELGPLRLAQSHANERCAHGLLRLREEGGQDGRVPWACLRWSSRLW